MEALQLTGDPTTLARAADPDPPWAFVDESGDPLLTTHAGASELYSVAAVLARESELDSLRVKVDAVRARYFGRGVIKSKSVGGDLGRRVKILGALAEAGVRFAALVTDKAKIDRDTSGLRFRPTFVKFVQGFLYARLFRAHPAIRICADSYGTDEFARSFRDYMLRRHRQVTMLLADQPTLRRADDETEVLIQAADVIAGSVRVAYGEEESRANKILEALLPMSLGVRVWPQPPGWRPMVGESRVDAGHDEVVSSAAVDSATEFLDASASETDEKVRMQVEVVNELLLRFYADDSRFANTFDLVETLAARGFGQLSRDAIRRDVMAPLRDRGVLIVSKEKGYALARGLDDVEQYLSRMQDEVLPILGRVGRMRQALRDRTTGRLDILSSERFKPLRGLVECEELARLRREPAQSAAGAT